MNKIELLIRIYPNTLLQSICGIAYGMGKLPANEEKMLAYMIQQRNADGNYYSGDGARQRLCKAIGITDMQYQTAFTNLLKAECIIRLPNGKKNTLAYYAFHSQIKRLLKEHKLNMQ